MHAKSRRATQEFAVTQDHVLKRWSVGEIETAEIVNDPLDAAPRLPFWPPQPGMGDFQTVDSGRRSTGRFPLWTSDWGRNEVPRRVCSLARVKQRAHTSSPAG